LKKFAVVVCAILSALFLSFVLPGCGSSDQHTLFLISAGTPSVASFEIGGDGALTLNSTTFSTGSDPRGIVMDSQRRYAYVVNNSGAALQGGVLQYAIDRHKGSLAVVQAPDASSNITGPVQPVPTGKVPLAIAIDPNDNFVFVANSASDSISVYSLDQSTGALKEVAGSPFTTGATPVSLVARGSSLFVANQGAATISVYSFDSKTGALTLSGTPTATGTNTTSIDSDPAGHYLFVADGTANTVSTFTISTSSISATPTTAMAGTMPSNVHVDPKGKYLYVTNSGSNNVSAFSIGDSGALTAVSGSPFATGTAPSYSSSNSDSTVLWVANKGSSNVSAYKVSGGALSASSGSPYAASGFAAPNGLADVN
jgi:6-phosphogluconolactonase (cycloisomerase 2 family)